MKQWYKDRLRRTLLDMHIPDWNPEFMASFDPEEYFNALKTANIDAPMIYVQAHTGLCYWPTKVGMMHKAFVGCEDKMKRLFDMCHAAGMDVVLYYSLIYNCVEHDRHPEWAMRDAEGRDCLHKGSRYGLCCPNNMEYRAFVAEQIAEFFDYFDFEGVFFDMPFWPMTCYCDACRARWEKEVGGEMPRVVDWNDPRWRKFNEKRFAWMGEFAQFATDEVKKRNPEISVEHQYGFTFKYWRYGQNELISKASDYVGTDLYGGIEQQSFACKTWYNLTQNQPFQYMTSRCYPSLSEHTTTKSIDQLRLQVFMTYLHHGAAFLIDAIDPAGTIDPRVYEKIGVVYRESEQYEKYFKRGRMAYDVALFYDLNGKMDVEANGDDVKAETTSDRHENNGFPHYTSNIGAANSLRKHHIPFGVVNNWKLDLLNDVKVLVISDDPGMTEREIDAVKAYVKNGGKLYLSGHSAPELVEEVFGVKWEGFTEEDITYLAPAEGSSLMLGEFTARHPMPFQEKAALVSGKPNGEVLATLTLPYTVPTPKMVFPLDYFGKPVPQDERHKRFSSIHSNPPGIATGRPAVVQAPYGKGTVVWSALPIEKPLRPQHSDVFASLITKLMDGTFCFGAKAADSVECVMFDAPEQKQKLMGLINLQEDFNTMPAIDIDVWIKADQKPASVWHLPEEKPVDFRYEDGKVYLHLDRLQYFEMFSINFE